MTRDPVMVEPNATVKDAARMRSRALRRMPVVDDRGKPVGIVAIGDLAVELDPKSALGGISAGDPNRRR